MARKNVLVGTAWSARGVGWTRLHWDLSPAQGEASPMVSSNHRLAGAFLDPECEPARGWTEGGSVVQESGRSKLSLREDEASALLGQQLAQHPVPHTPGWFHQGWEK